MLNYIDPDSALDIVLDNCTPRHPEELPVELCLNYQLQEAVQTDRDYPPFDKAMMDGFAVVLPDSGKKVVCAGRVNAGDDPCDLTVEPGKCVEVMTGAPVPPGAEAVVPVEDTEAEGDAVQLPGTIQKDMNIARKGSDIEQGRYYINPGTVITPLVIANLAFLGYETISVIPGPSIGIIITGNEISHEAVCQNSFSIRDSNGPMLSALCKQFCPTELGRRYAADDTGSILTQLNNFSDRDVVILSGGVSAGKKDFVPEVIEQYGARILFHKVAQKPGKPLLFAKKGRQLIFGLPGNPLSCHLCFHRYIARALRVISGKNAEAQGFAGTLAEDIVGDMKRTSFIMVRIERGPDNRFIVRPLPGSGSADIFTPVKSHAYLRLDPGETINKGGLVLFDWFGGNRWMN